MRDIRLTKEGAYSYTTRKDGAKTIQFLKEYIHPLHTHSILDGTGCVGADTILFGLNCRAVHSIEKDNENWKALQHNVNLYSFKNIHLHKGDTTIIYREYPSDILYLDPPWGGPGYKHKKVIDLYLGDHRVDIFLRDSVLAKDSVWRPQWIILKLPFNYNWARLTALDGLEAIHTLHVRNHRIVALKVSGKLSKLDAIIGP
jgi:predicted RNA methylase